MQIYGTGTYNISPSISLNFLIKSAASRSKEKVYSPVFSLDYQQNTYVENK